MGQGTAGAQGQLTGDLFSGMKQTIAAMQQAQAQANSPEVQIPQLEALIQRGAGRGADIQSSVASGEITQEQGAAAMQRLAAALDQLKEKLAQLRAGAPEPPAQRGDEVPGRPAAKSQRGGYIRRARGGVVPNYQQARTSLGEALERSSTGMSVNFAGAIQEQTRALQLQIDSVAKQEKEVYDVTLLLLSRLETENENSAAIKNALELLASGSVAGGGGEVKITHEGDLTLNVEGEGEIAGKIDSNTRELASIMQELARHGISVNLFGHGLLAG
jgi:hypothetical protein